MDDFTVYEDFLPNVRMSLYGSPRQRVEQNHKKYKKFKIDTDQDCSDLDTKNLGKLRNRKATPYKNLKKRTLSQNGGSSCNRKSHKIGVSIREKKKKSKKNEVFVSLSSSSESFDEEEQLTPSKSEMESFQNTFNNPSRLNLYDQNNSTSDEDESSDNFDVETFFNSRDITDLNESIIEAHSGIDHEFINDYAKNVNIFASESINDCKQRGEIKSKVDNSLDEELFIEDCISGGSDEDVSSAAEQSQESMVISDDDFIESSPENAQVNQFEQFQEEEIVNEYNPVECHEFEDRKVVVLKENQSIFFHGLFTLKVLHGRVEILGHIIDSNSKEMNLYSPKSAALLYIKNVTSNMTQDNNEHCLENMYGISFETQCAVFVCIKLEAFKIVFIEKYIPQKLLPKLQNDNMPQVCFEPTENLNVLKDNHLWNEILNNVSCDTKLMIAGGRGVGKSTLLRFAINKLLNVFPKVKILDLDPGQSEFAVPGCLSIVTVTEPVFGPNFTHLKATDRSLLSNINIASDPKAYLKCIESLVLHLEALEDECPVLINYMGFAQGIGLAIISTAIKYIRPTNVIQIYSKYNNRNFKVDLNPKAVDENSKLFSDNNKTHISYSELNYTLHKIPAMNDDNDGWTLDPRQSREMNVLAYFTQMMQNGVTSLTSHDLPMYEIKLSEIKITNLQGEEILPAAANANMVALCSREEESNMFVCFGYGIVRGIDLGCDKLVLITPEPSTVLEDVYYLVVGSVFLPPSIYMTPDDVTGIIPYVMEGELMSLGQITRRSYLPTKKK